MLSRIGDWQRIGRYWHNVNTDKIIPVIAGGALPYTDAFTDADNTPITTHSANWTVNYGADSSLTFWVNTNACSPHTTGVDIAAHINSETFTDNQYAKATVTAISATIYVGIAVRCSLDNARTFYKYSSDSADASAVTKYVAGTGTQLGSNGAVFTTSLAIELRASGTTITPMRGGSTADIGAQTDSALTSGAPGVQGYNSNASSRIDDFEGGNLAATDVFVLPQFVAAGAQTVTNTGGATLSPALPAGTVTGDLLVMLIAGRCNGSTITNTFSNTWTIRGSQFLEIGAGATDLWIGVYTRIAQPSEAAPTVTPDADFLPGSTTGGVSAQIAGFRYTADQLDVAVATNTNTATQTWTPPSVTTVNPYAMVVSCVATADDNALNHNTANGFTLAMTGANYDTTTGSDHAVGMSYLLQNSPGAVTMNIWNESAVGNDVWVGVTLAFTCGIPWWVNNPIVRQAVNRSTTY